jgi:hypothetical protein
MTYYAIFDNQKGKLRTGLTDTSRQALERKVAVVLLTFTNTPDLLTLRESKKHLTRDDVCFTLEAHNFMIAQVSEELFNALNKTEDVAYVSTEPQYFYHGDMSDVTLLTNA